MDAGTLISIILGSNLTGFIGSLLYMRPKLKTAQADASKSEVEAGGAKFDYLLKRLESVEQLYKTQGEAFDQLRSEYLSLKKDVLEKDKRIVFLERENKVLKDKVENLEKKGL